MWEAILFGRETCGSFLHWASNSVAQREGVVWERTGCWRKRFFVFKRDERATHRIPWQIHKDVADACMRGGGGGAGPVLHAAHQMWQHPRSSWPVGCDMSPLLRQQQEWTVRGSAVERMSKHDNEQMPLSPPHAPVRGPRFAKLACSQSQNQFISGCNKKGCFRKVVGLR